MHTPKRSGVAISKFKTWLIVAVAFNQVDTVYTLTFTLNICLKFLQEQFFYIVLYTGMGRHDKGWSRNYLHITGTT